MDQAIAFLAEEGSAKLIEFVPRLIAHSVSLPAGANFFISHSGVSCNKGATNYFNARVLETKLAAAYLAKYVGQQTGVNLLESDNLTLGSVQSSAGKEVEEMIDLVSKFLKPEPYFITDILKEFELDDEDALFKILAKNNVSSWSRFRDALNSSKTDGLKLRNRALHVYQEGNRVHQFRKVCESSETNEEKMKQLGQLMDASHASCRDLYECSCKELDDLVTLAKKSGAHGARLTGAGWGGCVVSLVAETDCEQFEAYLRSNRVDGDTFTFNSKPGAGVTIYSFD